MIAPLAVDRSDATRRAELLYAEARSQIDVRLWRAALGSGESATRTPPPGVTAQPMGLATLLGLMNAEPVAPAALPATSRPMTDVANFSPTPGTATTVNAVPVVSAPAAKRASGLGTNASYSAAIAAAARRTNIPAAALASIIDAEAAKDRNGAWKPASRNARSSATGLGQFLSGTWKTEAQRVGTWLNGIARHNGWLGGGGTVRPDMQASLLALRNDADASINATADYARQSLDKLAAAGATVGTSADEIARAAYLGHNLGVGDAVRFLKGGLDNGRARLLLDAQVGSTAASRQITAAGSAAAAHRGWLLGFMARHVNASRF